MTLQSTCFLWLLIVAAYDFRQRRVPNWLVLAGAVLALAALALGTGPLGQDWTDALLGAVAGFGFLLVFYVFKLMGAGDVKFAGALGLWVGLWALLPIWVIGSLLAGLHAVLWLILQRWPFSYRLSLMLSGRPSPSDGEIPPSTRQRFIPYAAYLALAAIVWMVWGRQSG
ncbi:prepilin peptidase CpaA [Variovorax boronicumulans]|uniref:A24 family peptidase n=1 Tax=Variovorax boronicumulans TaxID=436515 RepID=UPI002786E874|nr:A24 family peptidase [Variovorax boronicumulans]MDQ0014246.1 prepilin peptidase CpaA [Variovorax boronicumulans]